MQYQAYIQQQSQVSSSTNASTIAAPSQLYTQAGGKPLTQQQQQQLQTSSGSTSNPNNSTGAPVSNWQTWFNPKG
jgi:hypothetical protein